MSVVWIVRLNAEIHDVCDSRTAAHMRMSSIKALPKYAGEEWRPVGDDGWASQHVTNLSAKAFTVLSS